MASGQQEIVNQLCKIVDKVTETALLLKAAEDRTIDVYFITIPEKGGQRTFFTGITEIDFKTGRIVNPDGSVDELSRRLDLVQDKSVLHSVSIHCSDAAIIFSLDHSGEQTVQQEFLFQLPYVTFSTMQITCTEDTEVNIFVCTNPQATLGNFRLTQITDISQPYIVADDPEGTTWDITLVSLQNNMNRIRNQIISITGEAWGSVSDSIVSILDTSTGHDHDGSNSKTLAASAVTTTMINTSAVTTGKIAGSAITTTLINTDSITNDKIAANAVTTTCITESAVTSAKIKACAVGSSEIAACAVTTAKIGISAVTTGKIAADAITTTLVNADAITNAKIGASAVTSTCIAESAVTSDKIKALAVGTSEIAACAVTTAKIYNSAVTSAKIDGTVCGVSLTQTLTNKIIELDDALSGDHTYEGITIDDTVGETVGFGDVLYMKSDGKWWKASSAVASSAEFPVAAMAVATIEAEAAGKILLMGTVYDATFNFTTLGPVYCGADVPTPTIPSTSGHTVQIIGTSLDVDRMIFNPDPTYIELA